MYRRISWINLPGALLIALLQRTPFFPVLASAACDLVASAPVGNVLKSVVAVAAALEAADSLAGATPLVPSSGTATGVTASVGTPVTVLYTVSGTPSQPRSWAITGTIPPGLNFSGLTAPGTVNVATLLLGGTPTAGGSYAVTLQAFESQGGRGNKSPVYPYAITVTGGSAATAPAFTTQPVSQSVTAGSPVTFTAAASGTPAPTYQWQKGAVNISGATTASYSIASAAATDAGAYAVVATNSAGSVTSSSATLTVNPAAPVSPKITTQPLSQTATVGSSVTFSVVASGTPAPTYQWQKDGVLLPGVTTASYTLTAVTAADAGTYTVVATNSAGSATSSGAVLTVNPVTSSIPPPASVVFQYPVGIARDSSGVLYVADSSSNTIRKITTAGVISTLAGLSNVAGNRDATGSAALFSQPQALAVDGTGNVYVADTGNAMIRQITPAGVVTTLAGSSANRGSQDGIGVAASFNSPAGIAADSEGSLAVADAFNATIRKVATGGGVTTLAGTAMNRGDADGTGSSALFNYPNGVAEDAAGNLYVADTYNDTIRKITLAGVVTTLAGSAGISGANDGTGIFALFNQPFGTAVDGAGNVYVADTGNATIRRVTPDGVVTTVAGIAGIAGWKDGPAGGALFNQPRSLVLDAAGNIIVVDTGNAVMRQIAPDGTVSTPVLTVAPTDSESDSSTSGSNIPSGSGGGSMGSGGGAMEPWFLAALSVLVSLRILQFRYGSLVGSRSFSASLVPVNASSQTDGGDSRTGSRTRANVDRQVHKRSDERIPGLNPPSRSRSFRFNAGLFGWLLLVSPRLVRGEDSISYKYETYTEADGRVAIHTEGALIEQDLGTDMHVKVEGVIDGIAGATPSGLPFQPGNNKVDPVNDPAWTIVRDRRKAWNGEFSRQFPGINIAIGFANSREHDYVSNGWSVNTITDFNEKNTQLLVGVAGTDDDVEEFYTPAPPRINLKKRTNDVLLGVNQLLDPHTSVSFNVTWGRAVGFLNDQHKIVPLVEIFPSSPPIDLIGSTGENRPDQRNKLIFFTSLNHSFARLNAALEASYRFYRDTFGTSANTLQLTWIQRIGEHFVLQPDVRLYDQTAANFYYYDLLHTPIVPTVQLGPNGESPPPLAPNPKGPFFASDYRLSALRSYAYGLKAVWFVNSRLEFDIAVRRYTMRGTDGVTPQVAYPRAAIISTGVKFSW